MSGEDDARLMRLALRLARRGLGGTSPNPMVGAVIVKRGSIIGRGWHRRAGLPHAEIVALADARAKGHDPRGATLYVTLEPCCTHGRTPPCTDAIVAAGIHRVVAAATDPNPRHSGRGFKLLRRAGVEVSHGILASEANRLNEAFNHWIVRHTPFVTVKAAMTLDGKIATADGESKWITGPQARAYSMNLRRASDAILVGINTVIADDPALTIRDGAKLLPPKRRIILDSLARTPLAAQVVSDEFRALTTIVVSRAAPGSRVRSLSRKTTVLIAPSGRPSRGMPAEIDLKWLLSRLGKEGITSILVEGGGEVNASFLLPGLAQRVAFFYAPKILAGRDARKGVAGDGLHSIPAMIKLTAVDYGRLGPDLLLTARLNH